MVDRMVEIPSGGGAHRRRHGCRDRAPCDCAARSDTSSAVGLFPHRKVIDNVATVPAARGGKRARRTRTPSSCSSGGPRPGLRRPLPGAALGRTAAARRRRPRARRRPEHAAHGRAVRRRRPDQVRAELQQELLRLQAELGKTIVFVTHDIDEAFCSATGSSSCSRAAISSSRGPRRAADARPRTRSSRTSSAPTAGKRRADAGRRHRPLGGAARLRRPGDRRGPREARGGRGPATRCWSTPSAARWAGSPTRTCAPETVPARPDSGPEPMLDLDDVMRDALADLLQAETHYAPVVDGAAADRRGALGRDHLRNSSPRRRRRGRGPPGGRAPAGRSAVIASLATVLAPIAQGGDGFVRDGQRRRDRACVRGERQPSASAGRSTTSTATSPRPLEHLVLVTALGRASGS